MRRQGPSQITGRHGLGGDLREVAAAASHLFRRRGPWGAHFARSGNFSKHTPAEDLTRQWAHGPAT